MKTKYINIVPFSFTVSTPEEYLVADIERDVEIQASNQLEIDWTDSFHRIYKEVAMDIGDICWTSALLKLFSEPKDFVDDSCDFNLTEPLTTMFGDVYEVVEEIPSFNAVCKSASDSVLFEATEEFSHGEIRSDAKQSKSFDQIQDWKMDLAVGIPDIQIVDRELCSGSRQSKNMEVVSYGQSVASRMSVVDIFWTQFID